jgi:ubiquinone/menaquinone biosynthesis C-methylase UbiE
MTRGGASADSNQLRDGMRRYWDDRAQENAAYYVDTTVDYDSPDLAQFFETGDQVVREALLDAPVQPAGRGQALEIGPGLGRICKALAPHFQKVTGLDVSSEMVERARELVDAPNVTFAVGDGVTLQPVPDASVDFVVTFTVLQHVPDRDAIAGYLRECARVLAPGGVAAVQWNGDAHPVRFRLKTWWWRARNRLRRREHRDRRLVPQFIGTPVPAPYVHGVLEDAGLRIEGTKGDGTLFCWVWARKPAEAAAT